MAATDSDSRSGAYKRVHKRFNPSRGEWEYYEPDSKKSVLEGVFNFIYNQHSPYAVGAPKVVEVLSRELRNTLKRCLPFVDTAVDNDVTCPNLEVDARTLAAREEDLQIELLRLQKKLETNQTTSSEEEVVVKKCGNVGSLPGNDGATIVDAVDTAAMAIENEIDHLKQLLFCIDTEFSSTKRRFKDLVNNGAITYDLLWWLLPQDSVITFNDPASELIIAGRIRP